MIQSLSRDSDAGERLAGYGQVIVDECHHVPAFSFERVLKHVKALLVGLTATPKARWAPSDLRNATRTRFATRASSGAPLRAHADPAARLLPHQFETGCSQPTRHSRNLPRARPDQARNEMIVRGRARAGCAAAPRLSRNERTTSICSPICSECQPSRDRHAWRDGRPGASCRCCVPV